MHRPKIIIRKKVVLDRFGHFRYRCINNLNGSKNKSIVFDLGYEYSGYPNISRIKTEKQLCRFIYDRWDAGDYIILAFVKGRRGLWVFWRGQIDSRGFIFERKKRSDSEEIRSLERDYSEAEEEWEKKMIMEEIEVTKKFNSFIRYGFYPYIISSGRRGEFVSWSDPEIKKENKSIKKGIWD